MKYRYSYNEKLKGTCTHISNEKYAMTQSIEQSRCDSRTSCNRTPSSELLLK